MLSAAATLAGDPEVEAKWNWMKGSKFVSEFTGDDTDLGAYTKLKFFKFAEYKFGDFKFAVVNLAWGGSGSVDEVTQFATQ